MREVVGPSIQKESKSGPVGRVKNTKSGAIQNIESLRDVADPSSQSIWDPTPSESGDRERGDQLGWPIQNLSLPGRETPNKGRRARKREPSAREGARNPRPSPPSHPLRLTRAVVTKKGRHLPGALPPNEIPTHKSLQGACYWRGHAPEQAPVSTVIPPGRPREVEDRRVCQAKRREEGRRACVAKTVSEPMPHSYPAYPARSPLHGAAGGWVEKTAARSPCPSQTQNNGPLRPSSPSSPVERGTTTPSYVQVSQNPKHSPKELCPGP